MDLLPDTADAATGKHSHRDVARYIDRHRGESPPATQSRHRLRTPRLDQGNALGQNVVSHYIALSHAASAQIEKRHRRNGALSPKQSRYSPRCEGERDRAVPSPKHAGVIANWDGKQVPAERSIQAARKNRGRNMDGKADVD